MKIKYFHLTSVVFLILFILAGLLSGDVSRVQAQSSRVWSDPINLSNSGATSTPEFMVDTLGVMHALWFDQYEGGYKYTQSADGKEWTLPEKANFPFNSKGSPPVLVMGPTGFIYVFWQKLEGTLVFAQAHSGNLGDPSAWAYQSQMSSDVLSYDATVDSQGVLHLVYIRSKNSELGPAGVYYARSLDQGTTWSTEKLLYESQYFRTTRPESAHVQVSVSRDAGSGKVFTAWDNTSIKRIFMSTSMDSGLNWSDVSQLKGPEDTGGYDIPYNVAMSVTDKRTLLMWEVGGPGANQCALYGQWTTDDGGTWSEPNDILSDRSICPQGIDFLVQTDDSLIALLTYKGNPSLISWNGNEWSEPQAQDELSYFTNPVTNEVILFGCYYNFVYGDQLFLAGCDQGSGGDTWITSRSIASISDWVFSASFWNLPTQLTSTTQKIPFMIYAADGDYFHALWSQSPPSSASDLEDAIYYSRWSGSEWLPARDVIYGLRGTASELSVTANGQGRLFLVWSDERNGDLVFSWANSGKANSSSEWETPRDLPSPSQWTSSPDILVDATGRIVVVYAVPFNEKRGIYAVQSTDNGNTWSAPISVFDAESAGWVMVNHPKITLSGDGRLHVLFTNYSGLSNQPDGLYYSQSSDSGLTWSVPDVVSEGPVIWSDIVSYGEQTVHRIWQQNDASVVANIDQVSTDGGISWGKAINITGVSDTVMPVTVASNNSGELHLIQLVEEDTPPYIKEYNLSIQDWKWDGNQWDSQPYQEMNIKGDRAHYSIAAGISSNGFLSVSLLAEYYSPDGELKNEIYNIGRSLSGLNVDSTPIPAVIATSNVIPVSTEPTGVLPGSSVAPTPYPDVSDNAPSALSRNLVGILLVLFIIGLTVFIFLRRAKRSEQG